MAADAHRRARMRRQPLVESTCPLEYLLNLSRICGQVVASATRMECSEKTDGKQVACTIHKGKTLQGSYLQCSADIEMIRDYLENLGSPVLILSSSIMMSSFGNLV